MRVRSVWFAALGLLVIGILTVVGFVSRRSHWREKVFANKPEEPTKVPALAGDTAGPSTTANAGGMDSSKHAGQRRDETRLRDFVTRFKTRLDSQGLASTSGEDLELLSMLEEFLAGGEFMLVDVLRLLGTPRQLGYAMGILKSTLSLSAPLQAALYQIAVSSEGVPVRLLAVSLMDEFARLKSPGEREGLLACMARESSADIREILVKLVTAHKEDRDDPMVVKYLISMLDYGQEPSARVLGGLAFSNLLEAILALRRIIEDPDAPIGWKEAALSALSTFKKLESGSTHYAWAKPALLDALRLDASKEPSPDQRLIFSKSAEIMGQAKDADGRVMILGIVDSAAVEKLRWLAIASLRWFPDDEVRARLLSAARSDGESDEIRKCALWTLVEMLNPEVKTALEKLASDPGTPPKVAKAAKDVLKFRK